jgi:HK97 family phage prohead protease
LNTIRRTLPLAVVKSAGAETRTFTISCGVEDRDGDILDPRGVVTTNYFKNPVVLWSHRYDAPPIGKTRALRATTDARLEADVEFAPTAFAQEVKQLVDGGFIRAASVGFNPITYEPRPGKGYHHTRWELLEWSVVSIPSNPDALIVAAQSKGLQVPALTKMLNGAPTWIRLPKELGGGAIERGYFVQLIRRITADALEALRTKR